MCLIKGFQLLMDNRSGFEDSWSWFSSYGGLIFSFEIHLLFVIVLVIRANDPLKILFWVSWSYPIKSGLCI